MATGGKIRIFGEEVEGDSYPSKMELVCVISDEEAEKLLFFFSEELNTEKERQKIEVKRTTKDGLKIQIWRKETDHNTSVAVVERLRSLVRDKLKQKVISGNSDDTFDNVKKIILNYKLISKVLPIQPKQYRKMVRIFGRREEELDTIKRAYENPGNPLAEKPSMFPETHTMSQKPSMFPETHTMSQKPSMFPETHTMSQKPSMFPETHTMSQKPSMFPETHTMSQKPSMFPETHTMSQKPSMFSETHTMSQKPSMFSETHTMSQSQCGRAEDRGTGSFAQMDVKYEFYTQEGLHVKLYRKSITKLNVDAIVNDANDELANIGGVAEVIERAAGSQMKRECKDIIRTEGKIQDGYNVTTTAGDLKYKAVIHAVGPRCHDHQDKSQCLNILKDTIINILKTARRQGYKSVAMPPISSGIFGVPKQMCAAMYLKGILEFSSMNNRGRLVEFHIIDIHDDVLDMVQDWHEKFNVNPRCLDAVLTKVTDNWKQSKSNNRHHWATEENNGRHVAGERSFSGFTNSVKDSDKGIHHRYPSKEQYNDKGRYILRRFCGKTTNILIYAIDILKLKGIDVIAVSEDPSVTGQGALSTVLLDAGDNEYRKEHSNLQPYFLKFSSSEVLLTSGGHNLPFHHVLHAVIRRNGEYEAEFQKKLKDTYTEILENASRLFIKSKNVYRTGINLALPMIGIGTQKDTEVLRYSCWTLMDAITKFLHTSKVCHIREIHLINNNENIIKMLQETFTPKTEKCPPPPTPKPNFTKPHYKDQYDTPKSSKKIETWRMDTKAQMKTDVSKYMKSYKQMVIYGDGNPPVDEDNCIICLSEMDDPFELVECKHVFCKDCIMEGFGSKPSCPVCGKVYGIVYGDQPRDGTADIFEEDDSLPGYDKKKTYAIYYNFPPGKQENFHPQPGTRYDGMKRRAFLPKNQEGTEVLELLRKAFEQGLTFTIGTSRTSGKEGVLKWNDICHKTSRAGGPQKFGYPDPEYLSRVKEELACKGITDDA